MAAANELARTLDVNQRLQENPLLRQIAIMVGIAASVAIGVAVVLWSKSPAYSPLFGNLAPKDAMEISQALQQSGVEYKIDQSTGMVMVPTAKMQDVRMELASRGLPQSNALGFELMQQDTGFGTSRLVENARYQRALEGELARTIMTLSSVDTARVHLATPKQSVFIRNRKVPSASVAVRLYPGRSLEQNQIESITHLVASSVPELDVSNVTVVDHKGRLLSGKKTSDQMNMTSSQFEFTRGLEDHFKKRIEDILEPLLGRDNLRAEVTAEMDFTMTEQTQERYNPDAAAVRSEQINEQESRLSAVQGVPGALTNQPPAAGTAPENATGEDAEATEPLNITKAATRNYEVDKTISHTRAPGNNLRRLSVAVVVNNRTLRDAEGNISNISRTPEEIQRITNLVKEAIGFNANRGDRVQVMNESFYVPEPMEPMPEPAFWEQSWFWDMVRQVGGVLLVLVLVFGVLRPTMGHLIRPARAEGDAEGGAGAAGAVGGAGAAGVEGGFAAEHGGVGLALTGDDAVYLPGPGSYEKTLEAARNMIEEDPKRVAQVVKKWIAEDG